VDGASWLHGPRSSFRVEFVFTALSRGITTLDGPRGLCVPGGTFALYCVSIVFFATRCAGHEAITLPGGRCLVAGMNNSALDASGFCSGGSRYVDFGPKNKSFVLPSNQ
jgi:hypothetical protein